MKLDSEGTLHSPEETITPQEAAYHGERACGTTF